MQMTDERQETGISVDDLEFNSFELHPECEVIAIFTTAEVVDIDYKDGKGLQRKVELFFQTNARKENGDYHTISKVSAPSFSPKASIRPMLKAFGEDVDRINPRGFKLSAYYGRKLRLNIEHQPGTKDPSKKYAAITAFLPLKPPTAPAQAPTAGNGSTPANDPFNDEDE